jgi:hypothetical protein
VVPYHCKGAPLPLRLPVQVFLQLELAALAVLLLCAPGLVLALLANSPLPLWAM